MTSYMGFNPQNVEEKCYYYEIEGEIPQEDHATRACQEFFRLRKISIEDEYSRLDEIDAVRTVLTRIMDLAPFEGSELQNPDMPFLDEYPAETMEMDEDQEEIPVNPSYPEEEDDIPLHSFPAEEDHDASLDVFSSEVTTPSDLIEIPHLSHVDLLTPLGEAVEIGQHFEADYYTFIHARPTKNILIDLVAKKLEQITKGPFWKGNHVLRHSCFLEHIDPNIHTAQWFMDKCFTEDHDSQYQNELLSVQPLVLSQVVLEYFQQAYMNDDDTTWKQIMEKQLTSLFSSTSTVMNKLITLCEAIPRNIKQSGSFHVVCIPKDKFSECGFLSFYGGARLKNICRYKLPDEEEQDSLPSQETVLERIQKGYQEEYEEYQEQYKRVQARLLTHMMTPDNGVRYFIPLLL